MDREQIIAHFVGLYARPRYLEIGVQNGITFDHVEAPVKVAVDPAFLFDTAAAKTRPNNAGAVYHEVTSDTFFGEILAPDDRFDVIFIDGLHSFDQTLRDLLNAILCLAPGGLILLDDVIPPSYAASLPTLDENIAFRAARGIRQIDWMGDVYKLIFFIRDYLRGFRYATLEENHGQAVLWREGRPTPADPLTVEAVTRLDFADAVLGREAYNYRSVASVTEDLKAHIARELG
jgi:hypothetical protein